MTLDDLKAISPRCKRKPELAEAVFPHLMAAMKEADISTGPRQAAFLAQLLHESGEFRYMAELADGSAYGPSKNPRLAAKLGNRTDAEAMLYKGRGPIQLTGRYNHIKAGEALGLDLVGNPHQIETYEVGFRVAAWYWSHATGDGLNDEADAFDFRKITRAVNGGYNGLQEREHFYHQALKVLVGEIEVALPPTVTGLGN